MYTSVCIAQFFERFQEQFEAYNFVGAVYDPEMSFAKLKPLILNNQDVEGRNKAWCGIIFNRQKATNGNPFYRKWDTPLEDIDEDSTSVAIARLSQSSCEVNFNIVSNELLHLEALENELQWYFDGRYEYTIKLNRLPEFKLDVGDITYGDWTKYESKTFGKLCSLGMAVNLNYPILIKGNDINIIKKINYILGTIELKKVFYTSEIAVEEEADTPETDSTETTESEEVIGSEEG